MHKVYQLELHVEDIQRLLTSLGLKTNWLEEITQLSKKCLNMVL